MSSHAVMFRRIAQLEYELWGEVYTAEAKQFTPAPDPRGSGLWESDATKDARAADMDRMLTDAGVE